MGWMVTRTAVRARCGGGSARTSLRVHGKRMCKLRLPALALSIVVTGCTAQLYEQHNPMEYLRVPADEQTERRLRDEGVPYRKGKHYLYVEKNTAQKIKDATILLFATPVTVLVDAGTAISVVGFIGLYGLGHDEEPTVIYP